MALTTGMAIGWPNNIDTSTLSGGSWSTTLPLSNIKHRLVQRPSRSSDVTTTSTKFDIDLGSTIPVQLLTLVSHTLSLEATYKITASDVSDFSVLLYDSDWLDVWPRLWPSLTLEWSADNWWSGRPLQKDIEGWQWDLPHVLDQQVDARYWRVEMNDENNTTGYIDIGRVFIGRLFKATINASYGASIGYENDTEIQTAPQTGIEFFRPGAAYRTVRFNYDLLQPYEAITIIMDMQRRVGSDKEVFFLWDVADLVYRMQRSFLGRLRKLSALEHPYYNIYQSSFEIKEIL